MKPITAAVLLALCATTVRAQNVADGVKPYVTYATKRIVLTHVRVIDGTGKAAVEDRNVTIENGKIAAIGAGADVASAPGTTVLDLRGRTVLPGLVGMHDHMYYIARPNLDAAGHSEDPLVVPQMTFSAPRLYLANGVTTLRTTGSVEGFQFEGRRAAIAADQNVTSCRIVDEHAANIGFTRQQIIGD